jgi:2-methylcitrate dehydratase PrpD
MAGAEGADQPRGSIATSLSGFVARPGQSLPEQVGDAAVTQILDWLGCAAAAASAGKARPAVALAVGAVPEWIRVLGGSDGLSDLLALCALGHALDFDSTHTPSMSHLAACVAPTVLWAGGRIHARGADVIRAYALGVECGARVGMAASGAFHEAGYHATAVSGTFATVAALGALVRSSEPTLRNALGIAGSLASGILEYHRSPSDTKVMHPGFAAGSGVRALQLAELGTRGPETVFEGRFGVYATLAAAAPDLAMFDNLGSSWHLLETSYKLYPNCAMLHPAIDALLQARRHTGAARRPTSISVSIPRQCVDLIAEPSDLKVAPSSGHDAKFSLQYGVAYAWRHGELSTEAFTEKSIRSEELRDLAGIVSYESEAMEGFPDSFGSRVTVRFDGGEEVVETVESPRGSPRNPVDNRQLVEKFRRLARGTFDRDRIDGVLGLVMGLREVDDLGDFYQALLSDLGLRAAPAR